MKSKTKFGFVRVALAVAAFGYQLGAAAAVPAWCNDTLIKESERSNLPTRYRIRQSGRYCEGVVPRPSAGALELVGYQQGAVAVSKAGGMKIGLARDVREAIAGKTGIQVVGVDWSQEFSYRFDGSLDGSDLELDTQSVIGPLKIGRDRISFLAWFAAGLNRLYVPVALNAASNEIKALFVSPIAYRRIRVTLADAKTDQPIQPDLVLEDVKEHSLIPIQVQPAATSATAVLKIVCWDYSRDTVADGMAVNILVPVRR